MADLRACIRTNLDCADICTTVGRALSRRTESNPQVLRTFLEACAAACSACGDECGQHSEMHEHCKVCADACRRCEQACRGLLAGLE